MAVRQIAITDTLETFRQQFNALSGTDFGDIATLDSSIASTSIVGAMNEVVSLVTSAEGIFVEDASSSRQVLGAGETLRFFGTSNQLDMTVSAPDTVSVSLTNNVTIPNNLTVTNALDAVSVSAGTITGTGGTHTLGTIELSGNEIRSTDSTELKINDNFQVSGIIKSGDTRINPSATVNIDSLTDNLTVGSNLTMAQNKNILFEGSSDDTNETTLTVENPTADRTITLPNSTGTVALTNTTGYAASSIFANIATLQIFNSSGTAVKTIKGSVN